MNTANRSIDQQFERAQASIAGIIAEKGELVNQVNGMLNLPSVTIEDKGYLQEKSKDMISRCERILDRLEQSFEPTTDAEGKTKDNFSLYGVDVYAKMVNTVSSHIRELRELGKMVMGIDMINTEQAMKLSEAENQQKSKNIKMSSSDLLKLIKTAESSVEVKIEPSEAEFTEVQK